MFRFRLSAALLVGVALSSPSWANEPHPITGPVTRDDVRIDIDEMQKGQYDLRHLLEVGRHFFSTPYTPTDGFGEGAEGPRMKQLRRVMNSDPSFNFPIPPVTEDSAQSTLLRLNGLDSQSCFECHNSIGQRNVADADSTAFARRAGVTGGSAGFTSNAFINPALEEPVPCGVRSDWYTPDETPAGVTEGEGSTEDTESSMSESSCEGDGTSGTAERYFMFSRNPPHVFGTGYAQRLAEEMSLTLRKQFEAGLGRAISAGTSNGTATESVALEAKGVSFGSVVITVDTTKSQMTAENALSLLQPTSSARDRIDQIGDAFDGISVNIDGLDGVSPDLVVRPFQWKGIAQNERNFVRDAANFHFGMESIEGRECTVGSGEYDDCGASDDGVGDVRDIDQDGQFGELTYGDVSVLTLFTMAIRPPIQELPEDSDRIEQVQRGREIFVGEDLEGGMTDEAACSSCHRPSLKAISPKVTVQDPREVKTRLAGNAVGLSAAIEVSDESRSPTIQLFEKSKLEQDQDGQLFGAQLLDSDVMMETQFDGYTFDLSFKKEAPGGNGLMDIDVPQFARGRLPENQDRSIDVPLFSDLKRHPMGAALCDSHPQGTDVEGIAVRRDEFLTRPLWGVADTGPWLHDGRATSLRNAILLHKGAADGECRASEANAAVARFERLEDSQQEDVIAFLQTLRLPTDPRYSFDE